jgi:hypothetical protein
MKMIFLFAISFCCLGFLNAQVKPVITPVLKQTQVVRVDTNKVNYRQVPATSAIKRAMPATVNEALIFYNWKATRWVSNNMWSGPLSVPFTFNSNGTISCINYFIPGGLDNGQLVSGTYMASGNNVIIIIKKDTSAIMTCNLVYDNSTQKLTGTYNCDMLHGYGAGSSYQGEMKLEINPN